MRKGRRSWGRIFDEKVEKQNKDGETQTTYNFCVYHGFGNPFRCINAAKRRGLLMMWKIQQTKGNDAYSDRLNTEAKLFCTKVETNKAKMRANVLA